MYAAYNRIENGVEIIALLRKKRPVKMMRVIVFIIEMLAKSSRAFFEAASC